LFHSMFSFLFFCDQHLSYNNRLIKFRIIWG